MNQLCKTEETELLRVSHEKLEMTFERKGITKIMRLPYTVVHK